MLAWIDLEATSLASTAHILEVAAIVTDEQLREVGRFHRVVHCPIAEQLAHLGPDSPIDAIVRGAAETGVDNVVIELHAKHGLWAESARSPHRVADVDEQLTEFLASTATITITDATGAHAVKAQLAGSSVWYDRSVMGVSLPSALKQLHYRCIDVTTLNELARRFCPAVHEGIPQKREVHRSMPDIEDSLALCRYYVGQVTASSLYPSPTLREIMGEQVEGLLRQTGAEFLQFAKKKVTERKALVAVFACALREALDALSPDERAAWMKIAMAEVQRS